MKKEFKNVTMTIADFISHIKHRSLGLIIIENTDETLYEGSIGEYLTSCVRSEVDNDIIDNIIPDDNVFIIYAHYEKKLHERGGHYDKG